MARLDVYRNPGRAGGYILDVQAPLLELLNTRAVVPLLPVTLAPAHIRDLNPVFDSDVVPHVMPDPGHRQRSRKEASAFHGLVGTAPRLGHPSA